MTVASYKQRAEQLFEGAANCYADKIVAYHRVVEDAWYEANRIPAGCGGTPFRSDARQKEERLTSMMKTFATNYGVRRLTKLRKDRSLFYGMRKD